MEALLSWSHDDVVSFFESIKLGEFVEQLREHEVDGGLLYELISNEGLDELGVRSKLQQAKLKSGLRAALARAPDHPPGGCRAEAEEWREPRPGTTPTICLLGLTGGGKSTTANSLLGDQSNTAFKTGDTGKSVTDATRSVTRPWRASGPNVTVIDTPGWLDSKGQEADAQHQRDMERELRTLGCVHAFMVILKAHDRFHGGVISMLRLLRNFFGKSFLRHLIFVFTCWDFDHASKDDRARRNDNKDDSVLQSEKARELNFLIQELFNLRASSCPCIFLDNRVNFCLDSLRFEGRRPQVVRELNGQLRTAWDFVCGARAFDCKGISASRAERALGVQRAVPDYLRQSSSGDAAQPDRDIKAGDQDVLHTGWLWWNRSWVYGKLCRGSLLLSGTEEAIVCGSEAKIGLEGCVCRTGGNLAFSALRFYFTIDKHSMKASGEPDLTISESFRFGVATLEEQKQWVWRIMDATQISDGCRRVQTLYQDLAKATSLEQYLSSIIFRAEGQEIVVPIEWMWRSSDSDVVAQSKSDVREGLDLEQIDRDLDRECISINGDPPLRRPRKGELLERLALLLLDEEDNLEECPQIPLGSAMALARDALLSCSRTHGGSLCLGAVQTLFGNERLIHIYHESEVRCSRCFTAIPRKCPQCGRGVGVPGTCSNCGTRIYDCHSCHKVLEEQTIDVRLLYNRKRLEALQHVENDLGLCRFSGSDGDHFGVRLSPSMSQINLQCDGISREDWIDDDEFEQCMICRLPFTIFSRRRHHCRLCGKLVCWICSRHQILVDRRLERVDYVCWAHSYAKVLHKERVKAVKSQELQRVVAAAALGKPGIPEDVTSPLSSFGARLAGGAESDAESTAESLGPPSEGSFQSPPCPAAPEASGRGAEGPELPCVSITMDQMFRAVDDDARVLFFLRCKYFRIVRWSGCDDHGRIFLSIDFNQDHPVVARLRRERGHSGLSVGPS